MEQFEEQIPVRSEFNLREAAEEDQMQTQLEKGLEELEEEEQVQLEEERKQRKASEEQKQRRGKERERIRIILEELTEWLEKIGCGALAAEIESARQLEQELEKYFGFPPPTDCGAGHVEAFEDAGGPMS